MKVTSGSVVVRLLCCLWASARCFYIDWGSMVNNTRLLDVSTMAVSKYDNASNSSYMVIGVNGGQYLEVFRVEQSTSGLPSFYLLWPPSMPPPSPPPPDAFRRVLVVTSVCTITSTIYEMINDVFLIAINCAGTPNKSYLHTMVNYKSSITFDYTINN